MKISKVRIYDFNECVEASKYPMAVDTGECNSDITNTVKSLGSSDKGEGHDQFTTGIRVNFDLTFTNKAWVELERYRFIEFVSSQSTMHRITKLDIREQCNNYVWDSTICKLEDAITDYGILLEASKNQEGEYLKECRKDLAERYLEILYNIPSGFELTARLTTNYRALKTVHSQRKNHRLLEWRQLCEWIETLPKFKELMLGDETNG